MSDQIKPNTVMWRHSLVAEIVNGQPMVDANLVEMVLALQERRIRNLARVIEDQGYVILDSVIDGSFELVRKQ